ncbi:MAG: polysaccharide deacetylase family protein [Desulfobacterales bacterium]
MTIIIETSETRTTERDYILCVVLGEFLGLDWRRVPADRYDTRITMNGYPGEIRMPDKFMSIPEDKWLRPESLPPQPLKTWDSEELGLPVTLIDKKLPVIYGALNFLSAGQPANLNPEPSTFYLPIDIFGSAFFMLTRYEEIVKPDRDEHDRFPAWASLAFQEGFLERPVVDEYVEVLGTIMKQLWPGLKRKAREFAVKVSHDVDGPSRYGFKTPWKLVRAMGGDVLKRRDFASALRAPWIRATTKTRLHPKDPANTFDWIMDVSESNGLTSAFYFMCGQTDPAKDGDYDARHPAIRALIRKIHQRGHEIGLHPSYGTYKRPDLIAQEADNLKKICAEENISQTIWGGRMHYLRWQNPITLRGWEQTGMDYDSTLSFADHAGFRCGTCHEYPAFDLLDAQRLQMVIRPLIAMDCTVMAAKYMGLNISQGAIEMLRRLRQASRIVSGQFTILWHNTELECEKKRIFYEQLL